MGDSGRKLLLQFDVQEKDETAEGCLLVYQTAAGFSIVATSADNGDAEIFFSREEFAQLQQRLWEVPR